MNLRVFLFIQDGGFRMVTFHGEKQKKSSRRKFPREDFLFI